MPTYEYKCKNGHQFEVIQRMSDDALTTCEVCEAPVQRVFHPVAVHFKGSGFYNTDYGTRRRSRENDSGESNGDSKDSKGEKGEKKSEPAASEKTKSETKKSSDSSSKPTPAAAD